MSKDPQVKFTIQIPTDLNDRFLPTDNKAAVVRQALQDYFRKRDGKK